MHISIDEFKQHKSNTLQGFFTVILEDYGLEIPGFSLHKKGESRWIELPSKPPTDAKNGEKWTKVLQFYDTRKEKEFKRIVMLQLEEFLQKEGGKAEKPGLDNLEIFG
jgi:hypothetical protein